MEEMQTSAQLPEPDAQWRHLVDERLERGDQNFDELRVEMQSNTEITREIRDIVLMGRTVFRAFSGLGKALVWCWALIYRVVRVGGVVAAACTAVWAFIYALTHGGQPPK